MTPMEQWHYETADDLDQTLLERLQHFPRRPDMFIYGCRCGASLCLRAWLRLYHRLSVTGREHLPAQGSFVVVANHGSHLDALCLLSALPLRKLHRAFPAAAEDYFFRSIPRLAFAAIVVNALPFDREVHVRHSLRVCHELLKGDGNVLVIFPEGTRSPSGVLGPFKPGVGLLLAGTKIPIVPAWLDGAFAAWPRDRVFPRPRRLRLTLGEPRTYEHLRPRRHDAEQIAEDLRAAVVELSSRDELSRHQGVLDHG